VGVVEPVDALLQQAARLLGSGAPPTVAVPGQPGPPPAHPPWEGDASERAALVSTQLTGQRMQLHAASVTAANLINNAATITADARTQISSIQSEWERDKAAVAPFSNTPEGQAALATAGRQRVTEAQSVVRGAASRFADASRQLQVVTADLPQSPARGGVQALDAGFGRGGAPEEPGPQLPPPDPAEAARRRDEAIVNDAQADPEVRRLAQERLRDLRDAKLIGPAATDPIMGGDQRTRARGRLMMQQFLESGGAYPNRPPLTPDEATRLVDKWESQARGMVLDQFRSQLIQNGVSPQGAQQAVDQVLGGKTPWQVFHDIGSGMSTYALGGVGPGAEQLGGAVPHGAHWLAPTQVMSEADAKALEAFGKRLGAAGIGLDALITIGDITHGEPWQPAAAKFGGRTLGGIAGGAAAGALWGSFAGPEGTLIVGLLGAIAGAWGGDKFMDWATQ
jgi:hypothetical protein